MELIIAFIPAKNPQTAEEIILQDPKTKESYCLRKEIAPEKLAWSNLEEGQSITVGYIKTNGKNITKVILD